MSIKDKAQETAQAMPTAPSTKEKGDAAIKERSDSFRRAGQMLRESLTDDQKAVEGSKSNTITFLHAIWSPAHKQSVTESKQTKPGFKVVGFAFKASEDVKVPVAPLKETPSHLADVEGLKEERAVKAGEEFILNLVETAMFLGRNEYAGECSGEDKIVRLCATHSAKRDVPLPNLKFANGGSVKTGAVECAINTGGEKSPKWEVKAGYEMFANLYKPRKATRATSGANTKVSGEETKNLAAAFRAFYSERGMM